MLPTHHPEKGPFLRELQPGERFIGYYVLRSKQLEPFRDASRGVFLTLIFSDRSGQMVGRVWEGGEELESDLIAGDVIKLDGEAESYAGRTQIRVVRVRTAEPDEYDLRDMLPASRRDPQEMLAVLQGTLDRIQNPHLAALLNIFYGDEQFLALFRQAPAARRLHHAYLHGLLEHTLDVLTLAEGVLAISPKLDADLLLSGVLLHDLGKIHEYNWDMDIDYTDEGRLVGHIVLTDEMLTKALNALPDFPAELALRLRHMLLAHHGRYEWGSPRRPMTLEAIALHHIENLSAQLNRFESLLEERPSGESWTNYDRMLGRQLYGGGDDDLTIEERSREE